jgi:type IV pilus assembly protein PilM
MALPFLNNGPRRRDQMLAIDLGGRTTKAVEVQRRDESITLTSYALLDAPVFDKHMSAEMLADHLRAVCSAINNKTKATTLALGVNDAITRHTELPQMPVSDMRLVLKNNPKNYLQQDLQGHVFDCFAMPPRTGPGDKGKATLGASQKFRVLVAGAKKQLVNDVQTAMRNANLVPDHLVPGLIGPANAFELAMPEVFTKEVVALVDLGFKHTSICILQQGELALSRVVAIGGDRLTAGLAEALGISYAEAEGIKIGMPAEVQSQLESLVLPLGRELRASIDFFEHQQDKTVTQVFVSGGSAKSEFLLQCLQTHLMMECKLWNPLSAVRLALAPQQAVEVEHVAPQLGVALGAALAAI